MYSRSLSSNSVGRVWLIRESDPIWFQIICQNDGIGEISSTIAIILTFLILKPIDLILDKIWHRPEGTEWLEVGLTENGVTVKRTYRAGDAGTGVDNAAGRSCCGEITVFETHPLIQMDEYLDAEKNAVRVHGVWLEIGENTRENIYTPQQQKHWLDQPEGKSGSINSVKKHSDTFDLNINLANISDYGGWDKVQEKHFTDGGIFDQIYER